MSESIRVALLTHNYHPIIGGAERQIKMLAPLLRAKGDEYSVITRQHAGLSSEDMVDGVPVYRIPTSGPKVLASLLYTRRTLKKLNEVNPDIVHAFSLFSPLTTGVLAKLLLRKPVVVKVLRGGHLGDVDRMRHKFLGRLRMTAFRHLADAFIVISREIDYELVEMGVSAHKRHLIPNGVDCRRFSPPSQEEKQALRDQLGIDGGPVVVFTGRLVTEKRVDLLIQVWPGVRRAHPGAGLLIAGTGDVQAELEAQAGAGVRFLGRVEDVASLLKTADLYVLPSDTEGLSNSLLEAMASGLPVVATRVGGTSDIISHNSTGWLINPGHPDSLEKAICHLLDRPAEQTRLGIAARDLVSAHYNIEIIAEQLHDLYRSMLES